MAYLALGGHSTEASREDLGHKDGYAILYLVLELYFFLQLIQVYDIGLTSSNDNK